MSKDNGGQAFPRVVEQPNGYMQAVEGMTLRDYFAAKAMQAMVASPAYYIDGWAQSDIAVQSYQMADALLAERSKP